jgi:hypothetical protein
VRSASAWLLSLAGGGAVAGPVHRFVVADPLLTAGIAVSYVAVARLSLAHPDTVYESDVPVWAVGRWSGLAVGLLLAVALFGVGPTLPVEPDVRFGLQVLVLGVGYAMWLLGVSYARAKAAD